MYRWAIARLGPPASLTGGGCSGIGERLGQLWLTGEVGRRCCDQRIGETVGWLGAALVLSRGLGIALGGPRLDGAGALVGEQTDTAFGLAFGVLALLMGAGAWSSRQLERSRRRLKPAAAACRGKSAAPWHTQGLCFTGQASWQTRPKPFAENARLWRGLQKLSPDRRGIH